MAQRSRLFRKTWKIISKRNQKENFRQVDSFSLSRTSSTRRGGWPLVIFTLVRGNLDPLAPQILSSHSELAQMQPLQSEDPADRSTDTAQCVCVLVLPSLFMKQQISLNIIFLRKKRERKAGPWQLPEFSKRRARNRDVCWLVNKARTDGTSSSGGGGGIIIIISTTKDHNESGTSKRNLAGQH